MISGVISFERGWMPARGVKDPCAIMCDHNNHSNSVDLMDFEDFEENKLRKVNKQTNKYGRWRSAYFGG